MSNEWDREPDNFEFEHAGFWCRIIRHPEMKHLCGYVDLPRGHPCYGKHYDDIDVCVHGGLTFGREKDGAWRVGFDCAHVGDLVPHNLELPVPRERGETYRNIDYVIAETKRLAEQLTIEALMLRKLTTGE